MTLAIHANSVVWDEEVSKDTKRRLVAALVRVFLDEETLRSLHVYELYWDTICRHSEPSPSADNARDLLHRAVPSAGGREWSTDAAELGLQRLERLSRFRP